MAPTPPPRERRLATLAAHVATAAAASISNSASEAAAPPAARRPGLMSDAELARYMQPVDTRTPETEAAERKNARAGAAQAEERGLPDPGPKQYGFVPVANPNPLALSQADIAQYNDVGYTPPQPLFTEQEAAANRAYFDEMMAVVEAEGGSPYSINAWHGRCRGIWDMCTHPRLLDSIEDLLGGDFVMWGSHFFTKMPWGKLRSQDAVQGGQGVAAGMDGGVPPHQDAMYWPFQTSRTVTVWLAIDDADEQNAAMEFVPGSHRRALSWNTTERADQQLQLETDPEHLRSELDRLGRRAEERYVNAMPAGWFSLHADLLVHGSGPNLSARRRCGLTMRFAASDTKPTVWPGYGGTVIRCRGDPGVWGEEGMFVEMPDGDDWRS